MNRHLDLRRLNTHQLPELLLALAHRYYHDGQRDNDDAHDDTQDDDGLDLGLRYPGLTVLRQLQCTVVAAPAGLAVPVFTLSGVGVTLILNLAVAVLVACTHTPLAVGAEALVAGFALPARLAA